METNKKAEKNSAYMTQSHDTVHGAESSLSPQT